MIRHSHRTRAIDAGVQQIDTVHVQEDVHGNRAKDKTGETDRDCDHLAICVVLWQTVHVKDPCQEVFKGVVNGGDKVGPLERQEVRKGILGQILSVDCPVDPEPGQVADAKSVLDRGQSNAHKGAVHRRGKGHRNPLPDALIRVGVHQRGRGFLRRGDRDLVLVKELDPCDQVKDRIGCHFTRIEEFETDRLITPYPKQRAPVHVGLFVNGGERIGA